MQELLVILIVGFLFFGVLRRFVFFSSYHGFNKAASDWAKQQEAAKRKQREGKVHVNPNPSKSSKAMEDAEYVDYEEVD